AVLSLGLRLARAGGRLRAWSIVAGNAFGVALLLVALALPAALYPDPAERAELQVQIFGILLFLLVPAVILLVTVGRLSSGVRDQRLAALRLLGLSPWRTRAVAAVENGVLALVGALLGACAVGLTLPWAGSALVDGGVVEQPPHISVVIGGVVVLAVTALSVLVGTASTWERELPSRGRAEATHRTPRMWRLVVLLVGLGLLGGLWILDPNTRPQVWLFTSLASRRRVADGGRDRPDDPAAHVLVRAGAGALHARWGATGRPGDPDGPRWAVAGGRRAGRSDLPRGWRAGVPRRLRE